MDVLAGRTVAILRAAGQSDELGARLRSVGALPLGYPVIAVVPPESFDRLDAALTHSAPYDWVVFTSANAAAAVAGRLRSGNGALPAAAKLACIGEATEAAVRGFGGPGILLAARSDAAGLAESLPVQRGTRVLVPASSLAGPELRQQLAERGASVDVVTAYRTVPDPAGIAALDARLAGPGVDALLVTSGSTVRFLLGGLSARGRAALLEVATGPALVSIGPATTAVAREHGLAVAVTAAAPTHDGMLDALRSCFNRVA